MFQPIERRPTRREITVAIAISAFAAYFLGATPCLTRRGPIVVVAGVFITRNTPADLLIAFRDSVNNYHKTQRHVIVRLCFFIGRPGYPEPERTALLLRPAALVQGNFVENINNGKTFAWFQFASLKHASSDIILKIDTDTSVNWQRLHKVLCYNRHVMYYLGRMNSYTTCGREKFCPPASCVDMSGKCWVYMSGGFYGVSTKVVHAVVGCKYAHEHRVGPEDLATGRMIKHCWLPSIGLRHMLNGDAWCHSRHMNATNVRTGSFQGQTCTK